METIKIPFKVISFKERDVLSSKEGFIELTDQYVKYFFTAVVSEPKEFGENALPVEKDLYNIKVFDKLSVVATILFRDINQGTWVVDITSTAQEGFSVHYNEYDEAREVFNKILDWRYAN